MTAPDRTTWTVAEDADGDETLWYGDIAVLRECDLATGGGGSAAIARAYRRELFNLLTRVLAPDEATIDRLAEANAAPGLYTQRLSQWPPFTRQVEPISRWHVRAVLAALAGTSAQARHTDGEATGGGEHG